MKKKSFTITLDGPAASGKSTLGERLAESLGFMYLDTGVMYRAVTLAVLKKNVDVNDEGLVTKVAEEMDLDIHPATIDDGRSNDVILEQEDVTWEIRLPDVEAHVSQVSAYKGVRVAMTKKQREIGNRGGIVMVGRDIGTVVLPDAEIKLYLDASVEERAKRRYLELINRGKQAYYESVLDDLKRRDKIDSSRVIAPLRPADDAIMIDSDHMDAEEVFQFIFNLLKEKKNLQV
ncbi:MAG: cytidylate kinase [Chloroflexi bacterium HGW-Chloroflexi-2]|jgi:cytidylate kinase|nr:MAG: cytidylate kinase [Chloroflexi bacterium HGW-Chloroflexi-2]